MQSVSRDRYPTDDRDDADAAPAPTSRLHARLWLLALAVGLFDIVVATLDFVVRPVLGPGVAAPLVILGGVAVVGVLGTRGTSDGVARGLGAARSGLGDWSLFDVTPGPGATGTAVPIAVHVGADLVEIFWDGPPPPERSPWRASPHGFVWESERGAHPRDVTRLVAHSTFVSVGPAPTGEVFVNLGAFRSVALTGDVDWAVAQAVDLESQLRGRPDEVELVVVSLRVPDAGDGAAPDLDLVVARLWRRHGAARLEASTGPVARPLVVVLRAPGSGDARRKLLTAAAHQPDVTVVGIGPGAGGDDLELECSATGVRVPFLAPVRIGDVQPPNASESIASARVDADSAASSTPAGPSVRLLGQVAVTGTARPLGGKSLELVAYLACHPDGVGDDQIRDALWPAHPPTPATWANRVSVTRRALGRAADGSPFLPRFRRHTGRLATCVGTDVGRLEAALAAPVNVPLEASELYAALATVRGRPFAAPDYGWAREEGHIAHAERVVVKAAHRLVTHAFDVGDGHLGAWAAERGLKVCPDNEQLARDRIRGYELSGEPLPAPDIPEPVEPVDLDEDAPPLHPDAVEVLELLGLRTPTDPGDPPLSGAVLPPEARPQPEPVSPQPARRTL